MEISDEERQVIWLSLFTTLPLAGAKRFRRIQSKKSSGFNSIQATTSALSGQFSGRLSLTILAQAR